MEQRFSLGNGRGWLTVREEGPRAAVRAELADDGRGLYKVWLLGGSGQVLLGTLAPQGDSGRLEAGRTLSVDALHRQGVWPVTGGRVELAFAFHADRPPAGWEWAERPGELFQDTCIFQAARHQGRALYRREEDGWTLAYPYRPDKEFPLTVLFCFSRLNRVGEELFCLFSFDKSGWPVVQKP